MNEADIEDEHTLILRAKDQSLLGSPLHRLTLPNLWNPAVGQTFRVRAFTAEIVQVNGANFVATIRFRFKDPLDSKRLHFQPPHLQTAISQWATRAKKGGDRV